MGSPTPVNHSLDPWLLAKERYLAGLEPREKALFHEATLENLYYGTSNLERDDRTSKSRTIIQKLQPLVEKIEDNGKALDAFANIAPMYLSLIWGSIRVLMVIARAYGKFYNRIVETFGRIGDVLPRFRDYERIFDGEKHQRLTQAISNTYLDIIELCLDFRILLQGQKASSLKRIWKPISLDGKFEEAIQRFREHRKIVEKEAETCHMIEAAETKALVEAHKKLVEADRKAKIRARLLAQLSCQDYTARHRALRKLRHQDTGTWVLLLPEYKNWQSNASSAVLSLYGIPGCGKSVLVSSIYDALTESSREAAAVAYYCDYADKRTLDPLNIFGSMTHAFLQRIEIPSSVQSLIEKAYCDGNRVPQLHEVLLILKTIVETSFESVTILVDGLDEMKEEERQLIYSGLRDVLTLSKTIKLFLSSRNDESQTLGLDTTVKHRICLLPDKISIDINDYIQHAVHALQASRRLILRNSALEKEILDTLTDGAKGMFLWVKFQLDDLCTAETDAEIRTMLQNLPKDLSETYDRLLGRVMGRQREQLIRRMFDWILCSKRPLSVDEMQEAIAFTIDDLYWDESKIPNDMARLIRACGNLVVVDEEITTVQFAHYTVEQYLLRRSAPMGSSIPFSLQQANITAAEMCLAYLSFSDFETQISSYVDDTTANMSVIESLVMKNPLLPNQQIARTAQRIWSSVRPSHAKTSSSGIDYRQYVPKRMPPNDRLREKYRILAYVADFWLLHTSALDNNLETTSRAYILFNRLLNHKRLAFETFPWRELEPTSDKDLLAVVKLGWAIKNNHALLLRSLPNTGHISRLDQALHFYVEMYPYPCISKLFLDKLESFNGMCPNSTADALCWLYARLVDAARQGQVQIFTCVAKLLPLSVTDHIILEATKHGHLELVERLLPHSSGSLPVSKLEYFDKQQSNLMLNTLEVAAFQGHPKIVRLFLDWDVLDFSFDHVHEGVTTLVRAINQCDISVVDALELALFPERELYYMTKLLEDSISDAFKSACGDGNSTVAQQLIRKANYFRPGLLVSELIAASDLGNHEILKLLFLNKSEFPNWEPDMRLAFQTIAISLNVRCVELFLEVIEEYTNPIERVILIQSPLFAAAAVKNIKVVRTLLASCQVTMPYDFQDTIQDAGMANCDATAIRQAAILSDSIALKTLIKGAVSTSDFRYLELCVTASLSFPNNHVLDLPEIEACLKSAFGSKDRAIARHMVEIILDLKPGAPWGSEDIKGDEIEAPLIYIAGRCAVEIRIAETLLSTGGGRKYSDKYNYMILHAANKCGTPQTVEMVLDRHNFTFSFSSWVLTEEALSHLGSKTRALLSEKRRAASERKRQKAVAEY